MKDKDYNCSALHSAGDGSLYLAISALCAYTPLVICLLFALLCWYLNAKLKVYAGVAQLAERNLPKVEVEGSNPFARSEVFD